MRFSIIIPIYNVAQWLHTCLESVRSQIEQDWECICIDDGSTDGSGRIADTFAEMDCRFRSFHIENSGQSIARNRGMAIAKGEYVCFVDADDAMAPDYLTCMAKGFSVSNKIDMVDIQYCTISEGAKPPNAMPSKEDVQNARVRRIAPADHVSYYSELIFTSMPWKRGIRRSIIGDICFKPGVKFEDLRFISDIFPCVRECVAIDKECYYYRLRKSSTMGVLSRQSVLDYIDGCMYVYRSFVERYAHCTKELRMIRHRFSVILRDFLLRSAPYGTMLPPDIIRAVENAIKANVCDYQYMPYIERMLFMKSISLGRFGFYLYFVRMSNLVRKITGISMIAEC